MYDPKDSDVGREWLEIYNSGDGDVDLSGWKFFEAGVNHGITLSKGKFVLSSGGYAILAENAEKFLSEHSSYGTALLDSSFSLSNDGESIALKNKEGEIVGGVAYLKTMGGNGNGYSIELKQNNWLQSFIAGGTPGKENSMYVEPKPIEPKIYPKSISVTELFPNPFVSQYEEYIELYNGAAEDVDLQGWTLHDGSKSGKYVFPVSIIVKAKEYLTIFKKDFKFALNNSGDESVTLFDPNNVAVSIVEYNGSKKNVSYNFDGERWRWSKFLTPGTENILNNEPYGSVKIDKDVFVNTYADFSISTDDLDGDKVKVVWDFGDKHKSYLAKTRHKYEKEGLYDASVKLSDGSEDVVKNFIVEVKEFPHPKVRIITISANPKGADTGVEFLIIENKSNKKINLNGWSIATGWKEKFINHPIREDFVIPKNKAKEITSEFSSFALNNTKAKIQLRYPDGKIAHEVKYKSPNKSIADGEIYRKVEGGWAWIEEVKSQNPIKSIKQDVITDSLLVIGNQSLVIKNVEKNKIEEVIVPFEIFENKLVSLSNENVKIELLKTQPRVLGTEIVREVDGIYFLTPEAKQKEHYAIIFINKLFLNLNSKLNSLFIYLIN
jgi:hypothetical protein